MRELNKLISACGFPQRFLADIDDSNVQFQELPWLSFNKKSKIYRISDWITSNSLTVDARFKTLIDDLNLYEDYMYWKLDDSDHVHILTRWSMQADRFDGQLFVGVLDSKSDLGISFAYLVNPEVASGFIPKDDLPLFCCHLNRQDLGTFTVIDDTEISDATQKDRLKLLGVLIYKYTLLTRYPRDE